MVDLRAFREGMARATNMQKTVATPDVLADFHPVHAVYVAVQNQVSVLAEQLTALPETAKLADRIEAAQDEYMAGGPPMSPLTTSYFTCWAFFDAAVGPRRETLGTCVVAVGKLLGMDPSCLSLVQVMQDSCMRVYVHEGFHADGTIVLRDLATGATVPPPLGAAEVSLVFTTPYVLRGASEPAWIAYLQRAIGAAKGDANKTVAVLKYGVDWSEYIFAGYAGHVTEAIFLEGLPDVPASLPHYSPRTR